MRSTQSILAIWPPLVSGCELSLLHNRLEEKWPERAASLFVICLFVYPTLVRPFKLSCGSAIVHPVLPFCGWKTSPRPLSENFEWNRSAASQLMDTNKIFISLILARCTFTLRGLFSFVQWMSCPAPITHPGEGERGVRQLNSKRWVSPWMSEFVHSGAASFRSDYENAIESKPECASFDGLSLIRLRL